MNNWRQILSWQESFGNDEGEQERNNELMRVLQQNNIPFTITKEPGQRKDEGFVLMIGDGSPGTLYTAAGYGGYFLDVLKVDSLLRAEPLNYLVEKIKFLQGIAR